MSNKQQPVATLEEAIATTAKTKTPEPAATPRAPRTPRPRMAAPARSLHNALSDEAATCHALQRLLASNAAVGEIGEAINVLARATLYRERMLAMFLEARESAPKEES